MRHEIARPCTRANRRAILLALAALALACARPAPVPPPPTPPAPGIPEPSAPPAPPPCERVVRIEVDKGARLLRAFCEQGALVTLPVALGREPVGPKRSSGDQRTPEGFYRVSAAATASRFHLFLPIDYPSRDDADAALAEGRLSPPDHARILRAHELGRTPPADTPLGGLVGFHGEGARWAGDSRHLDWTYGCIALDDADIDFLAQRVPPGTPVLIKPGAEEE
jgi:hypothetical protein